MTKAEKASSARRKTGPAKIKHAVTASGRRRKKLDKYSKVCYTNTIV